VDETDAVQFHKPQELEEYAQLLAVADKVVKSESADFVFLIVRGREVQRDDRNPCFPCRNRQHAVSQATEKRLKVRSVQMLEQE
jgi:hypothetical protein